MTVSIVSFDDIFVKKGFNYRKTNDAEKIERLAKSIAKVGLLQPMNCVASYDNENEAKAGKAYQVVDGERRFKALQLFREQDPEGFDAKFPNSEMGIELVTVSAADKAALRDRSVIANAYREDPQPHELYAEVIRRNGAGLDTYEIGEVLNLQQPRVSEFLSFKHVCEEGHEAWRNGQISNADMVQLAALDEEAQQAWLTGLQAAVAEVAEDPKAAKQAKANARKALKAEASESGNVRTYANAGKPSRQTLASYVPYIAVKAAESEDETERAFFNAFAAAFKVINGELSFDKVSATKSYVTKKDAAEAKKALAELEEKATAKAEKAAAKAEKAKAKAAKEKKAAKPAKEPKEPKAKKPAAKKAAKKKPSKKAK